MFKKFSDSLHTPRTIIILSTLAHTYTVNIHTRTHTCTHNHKCTHKHNEQNMQTLTGSQCNKDTHSSGMCNVILKHISMILTGRVVQWKCCTKDSAQQVLHNNKCCTTISAAQQ